MIRNVPLIVILGSTGTGKTKLSIELARKFGAEIISADAMQVYKQLDIVTAKATKLEQSMAKHHMLDVVDAGKMFSVVDFRDTALPIIDQLLDDKKIPILVGGTNYYIESILWKVLVNPPPSRESGKRKLICTDIDAKKMSQTTDDSGDYGSTSKRLRQNIPCSDKEFKKFTSNELYHLLESVDPYSAKRIHPNNTRKIQRSLEVYRDSGTTLSAVINEQRNIPGGNHLGGPLRYDHSILFWLQCDQECLNKRLDVRIDEMLSLGLLKEIRNFYNSCLAITNDKDCTKGALQSIGIKEFLPYLQKYDEQEDIRINAHLMRDDKTTDESHPEGLHVLQSCLEVLRLVTKRYSRNQPKWIRNRFLIASSRQVPPIYELSTTISENWAEDVYRKAENVVQSYIDNRTSDLKPLEKLPNPRNGLDTELVILCEVCNRHFRGEFEWSIHTLSNKHKRQLLRLKETRIMDECAITKVE